MTRSACLRCPSVLVLLVALLSFGLSGLAETVDGYAVLMEVDDHPEGYEDILIDHIHIEWLTELLKRFGWEEERILVRTDAEVTRSELIEAMDWLSDTADSDDLVVFFVAAHGRFITNELRWNETVPDRWAAIRTTRKLLIVDACHAGEFTCTAVYGHLVPPTERVDGAAEPGIALSCVAYDEYAWVGVPEEHDPIVGSPFLYYLAPAFHAEAPDADNNGIVSVEEAFAAAIAPTQLYYRDAIFGAHPDVAQSFERLHGWFDPNEFPHPDMIDAYPGDLILDLAWYRQPASD